MTDLVKITDLTESEREDAKQMYLSYHSVSEIASKYKVARTSISYHANRYWKVELELNKAELFQQFTSTKKAHFTRMSTNAMLILDKTLQVMSQRPEGVSAQELKSISAVLESLDKIQRLDDGKPTEITEEKPMSVDVLHKKLRIDPFAEVPEIEYKDLEGDKEDV